MIETLLPTLESARILAIGAHCDDVEIGAGGTLLGLCDRWAGLELHVAVATSTPARAAECRAALGAISQGAALSLQFGDLPDGRLPAHFDMVKDQLATLSTQPWDLILVPHPEDAHQDHAMLGRLASTAFRDHLILYYEIPKWDGDLGCLQPNVYVPVTAAQIEQKWAILDEHYVSQRSHDWWDREVITGLARLRGMECRTKYAEAFRVNKMILSTGP